MFLLFQTRIHFIVLASTMTALMCTSVYAQYSGERQQNVVRSRPRMKVIEVAPESKSANYYTVLGAVKRSGVFYGKEPRIPIAQLLESAGGLEGVNQSSIRIVRNGQAGLQLYYLQGRDLLQEIQANDLVVVVPGLNQNTIRSGESRYIPVACIGLSERPVVLPLLAEIRTLDQLLLKIRQPTDVKASLRLLDPLGKSQTERLLPGSILFFDSKQIDRDNLVGAEMFPPAVPLANFDASNSMLVKSVEQFADNENVVSDGPQIPIEDSYGTVEANSPLKVDSVPVVINPSPIPPLLTKPEVSVITVEEPEAVILESAQDIGNRSANDIASLEIGTSSQAELNQLDLLPETPSQPDQSTFIPVADAVVELEETESSIAPPPPEVRVLRKMDRVELGARLEKKIPAKTHKLNDQPRSQAAAHAPSQNAESAEQSKPKLSLEKYFPIVLCLGGLGIICLVGSIVWSREERHQQRIRSASVAQASQQEQPEEIEREAIGAGSLKLILSHATPVIEELVVLPQEIQFHGEPVGQRRIIVHNKEEVVRGPHFRHIKNGEQSPKTKNVQEKDSSASKAESLSTAAARVVTTEEKESQATEFDIVVPPDNSNQSGGQELKSKSSSDTTTHRESNPQNKQPGYDVVVPQRSDFEEQDPGALERALRMLAREKNV